MVTVIVQDGRKSSILDMVFHKARKKTKKSIAWLLWLIHTLTATHSVVAPPRDFPSSGKRTTNDEDVRTNSNVAE